jgi:hypothetical protein
MLSIVGGHRHPRRLGMDRDRRPSGIVLARSSITA